MPYRHRPTRPKPQPAPVSAGLAVMLDEFRGRDFAMGTGMMLPAPEPPPPAPAKFEIPPWPEEERQREQAPVEPELPKLSAVEQMMADAAERGELEEPPALGPPIKEAPIQRPTFPAPDWNREQSLAIQRIEQERLQHAAELLEQHGKEH